MMLFDKLLTKTAQTNLRTGLHKVAAAMEPLPLPDGAQEITLKTAAYLIGVKAFKLRKEKQAMLDGIMNLARL
jgi:hypothetical protein